MWALAVSKCAIAPRHDVRKVPTYLFAEALQGRFHAGHGGVALGPPLRRPLLQPVDGRAQLRHLARVPLPLPRAFFLQLHLRGDQERE